MEPEELVARDRLLAMLVYCRPHESRGEQKFINRFLRPYHPTYDAKGNIIIVTDEKSETLFSAHVDTMHNADKKTQTVLFDETLGMAYKEDGQCLGADDGAGCWLLLEMIDAKIPGTYIFHRGEERGCIGSKWRATELPEEMKRFKRAIAFDRRANTSVITHQRGYRCCSEDFGKALAEQLGNGYELDPTGSYTDTASYTGLIGECTNVSVGYSHEHSGSETLDIEHCIRLRKMVRAVKWEELPNTRKPGETESRWGNANYSTSRYNYDDFDDYSYGAFGDFGGAGRNKNGFDDYSGFGSANQNRRYWANRTPAYLNHSDTQVYLPTPSIIGAVEPPRLPLYIPATKFSKMFDIDLLMSYTFNDLLYVCRSSPAFAAFALRELLWGSMGADEDLRQLDFSSAPDAANDESPDGLDEAILTYQESQKNVYE